MCYTFLFIRNVIGQLYYRSLKNLNYIWTRTFFFSEISLIFSLKKNLYDANLLTFFLQPKRVAHYCGAAEMKYMRRTAGYTWTDRKTNARIEKELKITPVLDKLLQYKRSWIQHVSRMPRNRLHSVMKHYCPTGRRNHGRPLKRLLDT